MLPSSWETALISRAICGSLRGKYFSRDRSDATLDCLYRGLERAGKATSRSLLAFFCPHRRPGKRTVPCRSVPRTPSLARLEAERHTPRRRLAATTTPSRECSERKGEGRKQGTAWIRRRWVGWRRRGGEGRWRGAPLWSPAAGVALLFW
jgi:hypothetical protein